MDVFVQRVVHFLDILSLSSFELPNICWNASSSVSQYEFRLRAIHQSTCYWIPLSNCSVHVLFLMGGVLQRSSLLTSILLVLGKAWSCRAWRYVVMNIQEFLQHSQQDTGWSWMWFGNGLEYCTPASTAMGIQLFHVVYHSCCQLAGAEFEAVPLLLKDFP